MKEYILYYTYKLISLAFYFIGDKIWRIDTYWAYNLYQKAMDISIYFDEKIGFETWKDIDQSQY